MMDHRLRTTLKLSIPAVLIACIGPAAALIDNEYSFFINIAPYLLRLIVFPFFLLCV